MGYYFLHRQVIYIGVYTDSVESPREISTGHSRCGGPAGAVCNATVYVYTDNVQLAILDRGPTGALPGPLVPCYTVHCMSPLHRVTRYIVAYLPGPPDCAADSGTTISTGETQGPACNSSSGQQSTNSIS
jgi:hypothetical protein